jgi:TrmH family RNA methyltransferase
MDRLARVITSSSNARLKLVRKLESRRQREKTGLFACEGEDLVVAALDAGLEPVAALVDAARPVLVDRLPGAETVAPELLAAVSTLGHAPRIVAVFRRDELPRFESLPEVGLALWRVGDPGNLGTLIRSAEAFGPAFVALSDECADPLGPKALRASTGSVFRVPIVELDRAPGRRIALLAHGAGALDRLDLEGPVVFVLGSEREGVPEDVLATCDDVATIPIAGTESLNVAIAGSVALYERARRRG